MGAARAWVHQPRDGEVGLGGGCREGSQEEGGGCWGVGVEGVVDEVGGAGVEGEVGEAGVVGSAD